MSGRFFDLQRFVDIYNGTDNTLVSGTSGNDSIDNAGTNITILANGGNDTIVNYGVAPSVTAFSAGRYVLIQAGDGNDNVRNNGRDATVDGGNGNDIISNTNYGLNSTITGGYGNDSILNSADAKLYGGNGDDTITNTNLGANASLFGNNGNDLLTTYNADYVLLDGGAGNDRIELRGSANGLTAKGGAGNDTIFGTSSGGIVYQFTAGDGNDIIYGFKNSDSLNITGTFSASYNSSNNALVFKVDSTSNEEQLPTDTITLKDFTATGFNINGETYKVSGNKLVKSGSSSGGGSSNSKLITLTEGNDTYSNTVEGATIQALGGKDSIYNSGSNVSINTGAGNDYIYNEGQKVTIKSGDGNDYIDNRYTDSVKIDGGEGNDSIYNIAGNTSIDGGAGNDYISNRGGASISIAGGAGNDLIYNNDVRSVAIFENSIGTDGYSSVTVEGGTGNDSIINYYSTVTIDGGAGNDIIYNKWNFDKNALYNGDGGSNVLFKYSSGDGNDKIYGFMADSTLSIAGSSYSTKQSGDDVIVTVGKGKISLIGAASLEAVNIDFKKTAEQNSWRLSGTTATYGTSSNTLITVSGVKSLDGISLSGKVITVAQAALNKAKVTLSGSGYKLKLANNVSTTAATSNDWSYKSSVATLKQTKGAYYSLAGNGKTISYSAGTSKTLAKVSGVKSSDGLSVKKKVVTVEASSLNQSNVTLSGSGYKLALASDVSTTATTSNSWSYKNSVATLNRTKGAYYSLASNGKSISYSAAASKALAKISGVKSSSGLNVSGNVITVPNAITASSKKVGVNGGGNYGFKFVAKKTLITGSAKADIITSGGANTTINAGKGNDQINLSTAANNVIVYSSGDGKDTVTNYTEDDTIRIKSGAAKVSTSGNDVVFTVGKGSITLKDAANKNVSYINSSGVKKIYSANSSKPYTVKGAGITLSSSYSKKTFSVEDDIAGGNKIVTIDASAVTHAINITGNDLANSIRGGKGNDTLEGSAKNDTLTGSEGKDVFVYYNGYGNDVITDYAAEDKISIVSGAVKAKASGSDVILTVGKGSIKVRKAYTVGITYIDSNDFEHDYIKGKQAVNVNDTTATITKNYWKTGFDVNNFGDGLKQIDASAVTKNISIKGNDRANQILVGKGNCTIIGGAGDDTYYSGSGANAYVYNQGDGKDIIYNYSSDDTISIASGAVSEISLKNKTVVFTVGSKGKISVDSAVGKEIKYVADGEQHTTIFGSNSNVTENWFVADDDNFDTGNDLSALVQSNETDCSFAEIETSLSSANALQTLTYASKK